MKFETDVKALFIIVQAGHSGEIIDIAREAGARGATIIHARGEGQLHKSFMGITIDSEKEIVLILLEEEIADKVMASVKEKAGIQSPARGICFIMPVEKTTRINSYETP